MEKVSINLDCHYDITIGSGLLSHKSLLEFLSGLKKRVVVIADEVVADLYVGSLKTNFKKHQLDFNLLTFSATEKNKSREMKAQLENQLIDLGCGRDTVLVALGGGVTTDLVGFVAATYYRGVPVVYLPTTLLAMVDASIGGKVAVNTPAGKNLIGAFYQPKAVFIDTATLQTLPKKEWRNGWVEMLKHAIIADRDYFDGLQAISNIEEAIMQSCLIKKKFVEQDTYDIGARQLLNFGHTVGHALEQVSDHTLSHGEAVALGMIAESYLSFKMGFLAEREFELIRSAINQQQIATQLSEDYSPDAICAAMLKDKKNLKGSIRFVLIDAIGKPHKDGDSYTTDVSKHFVAEALEVIC